MAKKQRPTQIRADYQPAMASSPDEGRHRLRRSCLSLGLMPLPRSFIKGMAECLTSVN